MTDEVPADATALRHRLAEAATLTDAVTDQVRQIAQALRPPALDALGVNAALEGCCRDFSRRTQLAIEYRAKNSRCLRK